MVAVAELEDTSIEGDPEAGKPRASAKTPVATGVLDAPREGSVSSSHRVQSVPSRARPSQLLGFIRLEDEIRPTAHAIINYFYDNDISPKIISGDDTATVQTIAEKVGFRGPRAVNLAEIEHKNYSKLVKEYNIFTRVTPSEKKQLINALKKQGNTVAMTGDGVNDILAMKEADVSLAIGEGSDAARRSSKIVLLNSDFESVPSIILSII